MRSLLLRVPFLRWCVLQHLQKVRKERREASWVDTQAVLVALGNITIAWSGINIILNHFLEQYQMAGGPLIRKKLPRSFTGKLEYMKEIERDPRWAERPLAYFHAARLRLAELNEFRISLVHGLLMKRGYGSSWTIHMAKEDEDRIRRWNLTHSSQDIHAFAQELSDMAHALAELLPPSGGTKR